MKTYLLIIFALFISQISNAQDEKTVTVTGVGFISDGNKEKARETALQDARRMAISQAFGTYVQSETQVENFVTVRDAISTNTTGFIKSDKIIKETPLSDRYEVEIEATVSLQPIKQDAQVLADMVGGINFIVIYDNRELNEEQIDYFEHAYEKINQILNTKQYSRTEATIAKNIMELLPSGLGEVDYLNSVGLYSNSEFIIQIKKLEVTTKEDAMGNFRSSAYIEFKSYDGCNWRNLGTFDGRSEYKSSADKKKAAYDAIDEVLRQSFDGLFIQFNRDIYSWVNKGAPYEFRFYKFDKMSTSNWYDFMDKLIAESGYIIGEPQDEKTDDFVVIRFRSKKTRYAVARTFFKIAMQVSSLSALSPEEKIKYGRQISYVPDGVDVPDIEKKIEIRKKLGTQ